MSQPSVAVRVAGMWLATASFLMVPVFVLHGPIAHDLTEQMHRIANAALRWTVVHWIAGAALSLFALAGLVVVASGSRLTESRSTMTAWALLVVSSLWTITTAVTEATVVTRAAVTGDVETFEAWWAFAEGMANGFSFFALSVAVIAANEARIAERALPAWSARVAMIAGVASFGGWAVGMWFGISFGSMLWAISSIVLSLWTLWFGFALMNSGVEGPA